MKKINVKIDNKIFSVYRGRVRQLYCRQVLYLFKDKTFFLKQLHSNNRIHTFVDKNDRIFIIKTNRKNLLVLKKRDRPFYIEPIDF